MQRGIDYARDGDSSRWSRMTGIIVILSGAKDLGLCRGGLCRDGDSSRWSEMTLGGLFRGWFEFREEAS
jgi:hypothetical protein